MYQSFTKAVRFYDFCESVQYCNLCERLCGRVKVISKVNGNLESKVIFIAEAPGRLGADKTAIPLYGDRTGDNFEMLLGNIGWTRDQIFITNSVLCNPRSENGNNATPKKDELLNCSYYLEMTLNLIQPDVIVTLGSLALQVLSFIKKHDFVLKNDVGKLQEWNGYKVFPLYHPGPRAALHRSLTKQRADFIILSKLVNPLDGIKQKKPTSKAITPSNTMHTKLTDIIEYVMEYFSELSFFKLTKILYLIDWSCIDQLGYSLSASVYIRQEEGPWCPTLKKEINSLEKENIHIKFRNRKPFVVKSDNNTMEDIGLSEQEKEVINSVLQKCKNMNDAEIKIKTYLTPPMKYILKQERKGRDMRKIPVLYKDKTSIDLDNI